MNTHGTLKASRPGAQFCGATPNDPYTNLFVAVVLRAARDAYDGDAEARSWLAETAAPILGRLKLATTENVVSWAGNPQRIDGMSVREISDEVGVSYQTIAHRIYDGLEEADPLPDPFASDRSKIIPMAEARALVGKLKREFGG